MTSTALDEYFHLLEKRAEPSSNDKAYPQYVDYFNAYLSHFGQERVYLVGSTTQRLKLRWSKDCGDADFLLLSGKLEVPVENVEFRADTPCFIWVKVDKDNIERTITLIDNKYLPSDVLRGVGPELFTLLRGIYLIFTSNTSFTPINENVTTHGITSKVGLAISQYCNLKIENRVISVHRNIPKRSVIEIDKKFRKYIEKRKRDCSFRKQDIESIKQAMQFISSTKIPGSVGSGLGYWEHFSYICGLVLERLNRFGDQDLFATSETREEPTVHSDADDDGEIFVNNFDCITEASYDSVDHNLTESGMDDAGFIRNIRTTYSERTCKDFVPAIKLVGHLPCMETWKQTEHRWLAPEEIEAICKMDVFFVARYAPVNPSRKDFCLSFTLAEHKLSECLSPVQRRVVLVMKAYLKGLMAKKHRHESRELKLTTFHLKTIVYRVCDITEPELWSEDNIIACIIKVVEYLKETLQEKKLLHYFVPSNLFAAFEDEDCKILLECVSDILNDPIGSIKTFFDLDDGAPIEIWLTEEEVRDLEKLTTDGGISKEVDRLEEAIVDVLRGLDEGPRDSRGNAPIQQAVSTLLELYFGNEIFRKAKKYLNLETESSNVFTQLWPLLSKNFGAMIGHSYIGQMCDDIAKVFEPFDSEEEKRRTFERLKYLATQNFGRGEEHG